MVQRVPDSPIEISLDQLRGMIGLRVLHEGEIYQVIEVLEDGPSLVLESRQAATSLQADQFGEYGRWVPTTCTVPVLVPARDALHPTFLALDLIEHP